MAELALAMLYKGEGQYLFRVNDHNSPIEPSKLTLVGGIVGPGEEPIDAMMRTATEQVGQVANKLAPEHFFHVIAEPKRSSTGEETDINVFGARIPPKLSGVFENAGCIATTLADIRQTQNAEKTGKTVSHVLHMMRLLRIGYE